MDDFKELDQFGSKIDIESLQSVNHTDMRLSSEISLLKAALGANDLFLAMVHIAMAAQCARELKSQAECEGNRFRTELYDKIINQLIAMASGKNFSDDNQEYQRQLNQMSISQQKPMTELLKKTESFAEEKIRVEKPKVRMDDVAGMEDVKDQIRLRMIEPVRNPEEARKHGLKTGGGILLYGPPGTGKTFLAKAVAGELDLPFFSITAADIFGKYVGESENNIRDFFNTARKYPLSVIFIDELESIFQKRSEMVHESTQKVISVILQELDGVRENRNPMLLLGATNAPWLIDEAFMRTGRFDVKA